MKEIANPVFDHFIKTFNNWQSLKNVVGYMKRTRTYIQIPHELALNQKVDTRSGTVCDVVKKIFEASARLPQHPDESTMHYFDTVTTQEDHPYGSKFSYLNAIVSCVRPVRHAQTQLECISTSPFISLVLYQKHSNIISRPCRVAQQI